eukprot:COSAG02_NODE_942_length_15746_cov_6.164632_1_plen_123_part_10
MQGVAYMGASYRPYLMHERVEVDVDVVGSDGAAGSEGPRKALFKPAAVLWDTHSTHAADISSGSTGPVRLRTKALPPALPRRRERARRAPAHRPARWPMRPSGERMSAQIETTPRANHFPKVV